MSEYPSVSELELAIKVIERDKGLKNLALVGTILRDRYKIPSVKRLYGFKLAQHLRLKHSQQSYQLSLYQDRLSRVQNHCVKNKKDYPAKRSIPVLKAKIANLRRVLE